MGIEEIVEAAKAHEAKLNAGPDEVTKALSVEERLKPLLPLRVVVRRSEKGVEGKTELSFSMDWNTARVLIFWSGTAYSILGSQVINAVTDAEYHIKKGDGFIFDPLAADCPIEVDIERWLNATSKYDRRNAHFTVRPGGDILMRALTAEKDLAKAKITIEEKDRQIQSTLKWSGEIQDKLTAIDKIMNPENYTEEET
jgi:hypothetical protein